MTISWENQTVTIRNYETLQQMMKEAVESDLENVNVTTGGSNNIRAQKTQVERLKAEIFKAYLFQTNDFREFIYGDGQELVEPTAAPTVEPTPAPTAEPTAEPTLVPTDSDQDDQGDGISGEEEVKTGRLFVRVYSGMTSQTIRWNSVNAADGYYIYGAKSSAKYKLLGSVSKNIRKWKHRNLKKGIQYKYRVAAFKVMRSPKRVVQKDSGKGEIAVTQKLNENASMAPAVRWVPF